MLSRPRLAAELQHACRRPLFPLAIGFLSALLASVWGFREVFGLYFRNSGVRIALFVVLAMLAFRFAKSATVRVGFAMLMLVLMISGALEFGERFPFESWRLYSKPATATRTVYFIEVTTSSGQAFRVDGRALGDFSTPSNHSRWAEKIVSDMSPEQRQQFARFVVARTKEYRHERLSGQSGWRRWWRTLRFPPHQLAMKWTNEDLAALENPTGIRVRIEETQLDKDHDWAPRVISQKILEVPCS